MTNTVWSREFSDIVGRIYEAATDPAVWPRYSVRSVRSSKRPPVS